MSDQRFWKLYRDERRKIADFRTPLRYSQILRVAQLARQRLAKEDKKP